MVSSQKEACVQYRVGENMGYRDVFIVVILRERVYTEEKIWIRG